MTRILIIGENENETSNLSKTLSLEHEVSVILNYTLNYRDASQRMQKEAFDVIIFELLERRSDPANILQKLRNTAPFTPIIVTSQIEKTELIVKIIKAGAFDFITKPYSAEKIKLAVRQALEHRGLKDEIDYLRREQDVIYDYDRIIALSPVMKDVISTIKKLANTDSTILMTGQTGTGKSFLSGTIHFNSYRQNKPFVKVNCANIPEALLESELFGHEKGSFTGASKTRAGRFEQANGGTIFLDEIGELSPVLQAKLLRVLEEKSFERLGGNKTIHSDVRIIAATNRNIEEQVATGNFREDLYYRINVLRIHLPPLHERQECIEPLAYHLLGKLCRSIKKQIDGFSPEVIEMFKRYAWSGNIRQLSNTIERAVLIEDANLIQKESVSLPELDALPPKEDSHTCIRLSEKQEKDLIIEALEKKLWVQKAAAGQLGITPRALNYRIKKLGITHDRWRKNR